MNPNTIIINEDDTFDLVTSSNILVDFGMLNRD